MHWLSSLRNTVYGMTLLCGLDTAGVDVMDLIMSCLDKMELYYVNGIPDLGIKVAHMGNMTVFYDAKENVVKLYVRNGGSEKVFRIPCECIRKKLGKK